MADTVHCEKCGSTWPAEDLGYIDHYWERVAPGGIVPLGQCPNMDCAALCYPPYGYVYDLERRCAALYNHLSRLLDWEAVMGGWEAPVWDEARRLLAAAGTHEPHASEGASATPDPS